MLIADKFGDGRVFLVGESAHVNPPWGGHGFNTSVGDAVNIAWKIAAVQQGWARRNAAGQLRARAPRRGRADRGQRGLQHAHLAGDLPARRGRDPAGEGSEFYSLGLVLGYSYAGSPVIQPAARPARATDATTYTPTAEPGARLPHWWLPDGSSLYDHLGHGFTLLCPSPTDGRNDGRPAASRPSAGAPATAGSRSPSSGPAVLPLGRRVPAGPAGPAHRRAGGRPR